MKKEKLGKGRQGSVKKGRGTREQGKEEETSRIWIEEVSPAVNGGRYPIKRTVGELVNVSAHIFTDGHDAIRAVIQYREEDESNWRESPLSSPWNDEWFGSFVIEKQTNYRFTVAAWVDSFSSWRNGIEKKIRAGQEVQNDLVEGAQIILASMSVAPPKEAKALRRCADQLVAQQDTTRALALMFSPELSTQMYRYAIRRCMRCYDRELAVRVDRQRARFSAWYEMFPRSAGTDPTRSATFSEAAQRLPDIAAMGFDVLYLPPIHPIGKTKRKGPNNSLVAGPDDPGCPWAIGNELGGHKAVEPGLGTIVEFKQFVKTAKKYNLEIALDLAYQCSPDHPYVREHPEWFRHRPDGSIHYAENPPKKYEDILPFNFECKEWRKLWTELKSIVEFWIEQGVLIFRVDNPHTKPFAFWEWLIAEIHHDHPDVIFLSEAFTRPKLMAALAKLGFTQSYTYFTWRNYKDELVAYVSELTQSPLREYFRPNFFANTPDILHEFLQHGGRASFQIRVILAATLSASFGIYSGFELCEHEAVPGTEEYQHSEKYQIKIRNWNDSENIKDTIKQLNAIRRANRALQFTNNLSFLEVTNPNLVAFFKSTPDNLIRLIVVININPHQTHEGVVRISLGQFGLPTGETFKVTDLLSNQSYTWGRENYVRLDPLTCPAHIFEVS